MVLRQVLSCLIAPTMAMAQSYGLEELTNDHAKHIAPLPIQQFMRSALKSDLKECIQESGASQDEVDRYFGAVKINLSKALINCYAVFPSKWCMSFYGAHAIAYWLITEFKPGRFRILYSGRSDGFELRKSASNGYYDFWSGYGRTYTVLRFNGAKYRRVSSGEYPND